MAEISKLQLASVAVQAGLCLGWSETPKDTFSHGVAHMMIRYVGQLIYQKMLVS